jgi:hypothetical protein
MKEDPKRQIHTTLFHRQIVDKWKEFMARSDGKKMFRLNQCAIWMDSYDWKREMRILVNNIQGQKSSNSHQLYKKKCQYIE